MKISKKRRKICFLLIGLFSKHLLKPDQSIEFRTWLECPTLMSGFLSNQTTIYRFPLDKKCRNQDSNGTVIWETAVPSRGLTYGPQQPVQNKPDFRKLNIVFRYMHMHMHLIWFNISQVIVHVVTWNKITRASVWLFLSIKIFLSFKDSIL